MAKVRTIRKAFEEIKQADPNTCLTEHHIRQLAINGVIPCRKAGSRYLLELDGLLAYIEGESLHGWEKEKQQI